MEVKVTLHIKAGTPGEIFGCFKKLETFVKRRFINVTDFKCEKQFWSPEVTMSFKHDGYTLSHKDPDQLLLYKEIQLLNG